MRLLVAVLLLLWAVQAEAINKCTTPTGVVYQKEPCATGAQSKVDLVVPEGYQTPAAEPSYAPPNVFGGGYTPKPASPNSEDGWVFDKNGKVIKTPRSFKPGCNGKGCSELIPWEPPTSKGVIPFERNAAPGSTNEVWKKGRTPGGF